MTPHQTIALALRLFAIWLGIQALGYLWYFLEMRGSQPPSYAYAFMFALMVVAILASWFFPLTIAGKLLPSQEPPPHSTATADTWLALGCTLIGLWTLTKTIPILVEDLFFLSEPGYDSALRLALVRDAVQLAIVVWLILGGKGVGKIFRWAQYAGIRKDL